MADRTLEAHKALVATLRADVGVGALCGDRIYDRPPQDVIFPYVQIGDFATSEFDGVNLLGMDASVQIHAWSRKIGRVECRRILAAIYGALHNADLSLSGGALVLCRWESARDLMDSDGVTAHGIATYRIITDG